MRRILTRIAISLAMGGAAFAARRMVEAGWRGTHGGSEPPSTNPLDERTDARDALVWAGVLGGSVWLARRLARGATEAALASGRS